MVVITWSEIRTLRERLGENEHKINDTILSINNIPIDNHNRNEKLPLENSLVNENIRLKERIDELALNEKHLIEKNEELQRKIQDYEDSSKRSYSSSSSSSSSSNETVITTSIHMEKIKDLTNEIEILKKNYVDLEEKYEYEKHELQTMLEQLREDVIELDKTKQFYMDLSQEQHPMDDTLQTKFDFELKNKLDDLRRILEEEYNEKVLVYKNNQKKLEQDNENLKIKYNQDLEQQSKEFYQEMEAMKIKHEKQTIELNNEIDRLKINEDANNRLAYTEKEFEQLKHDYYDLNLKQKELLKNDSILENQNQNLLNTIEQIKKEKIELKENFLHEEEKLLNEIKELNELNHHQKEELLSIQKETGHDQNNLKQDIKSLQAHINNYENKITQYEEFRLRLEDNLQKLIQQRDRNKNDLKLTQEILKTKEDEYNQLKLHFDQCQQLLQDNKEQYDTIINNLRRQTQELNQTQLTVNHNAEFEYREKLISLGVEKKQLEKRLQESTHALNLVDYHLQQQVSKIRLSIEKEYSRRYENDIKRHQYEIKQLQQKLTKEIENKRKIIVPTQIINNSEKDIEEIKKMYRTEIDRLYHENVELSQHQGKLIDTHKKRMEVMKKELDNGYNNIINEFQREQKRLETRCDQLKQQLFDSKQTIEQLKLNLNRLKINHFNDLSKIKETHTNENYTYVYDNKDQQDNQQIHLKNLVKPREQSHNALNQERTLRGKQVNEYQKPIASIQDKIKDMGKQHRNTADEIEHEFQQERLTNQRRVISRPTSVAESVLTDSSAYETHSDSKITIGKLQVSLTHFMNNLEISTKNQIQNELIRSRNSMIKEIRREIFEKITQALRSQRVPDTIIDMHISELDRLLSQIAENCLDSFPIFSSNSSISLFPITSQHQPNHSIIYDSSLSNKSTVPSRKSIECLYITPTINKQSASNILIASQNPTSSIISSPHNTYKYQQSKHRNFQTKIFRSENDLMLAIQRNEQEKPTFNNNDDTLILCKNDQQTNVRTLAKEYEQKTNLLSDYSHVKTRTTDVHYSTTRTIINNQQEQNNDNDKELTWPKEPVSTTPSKQTSGIRKFVSSSLKLFIIQPQQQQQHKRSGK